MVEFAHLTVCLMILLKLHSKSYPIKRGLLIHKINLKWDKNKTALIISLSYFPLSINVGRGEVGHGYHHLFLQLFLPHFSVAKNYKITTITPISSDNLNQRITVSFLITKRNVVKDGWRPL